MIFMAEKKEKKKEDKPEVKKAEEKPKETKKVEPKKLLEKEEKPKEAKKEEKKPKKTTKRKTRKKKGAPKTKVVIARGKRKRSVARATVRKGKGNVRINSLSVESFSNKYMRQIITEPLRYLGPEANSIDISVNVSGGGRN